MMAESLAARRPVVLMRPKLVTHSLGTERIAATVAGGGAAVLPILTATAEQFARVLLSLRVAAKDPRDVLARRLLRCWAYRLPAMRSLRTAARVERSLSFRALGKRGS
jgi:hypothetical protein